GRVCRKHTQRHVAMAALLDGGLRLDAQTGAVEHVAELLDALEWLQDQRLQPPDHLARGCQDGGDRPPPNPAITATWTSPGAAVSSPSPSRHSMPRGSRRRRTSASGPALFSVAMTWWPSAASQAASFPSPAPTSITEAPSGTS